jgi:hypothetical protein
MKRGVAYLLEGRDTEASADFAQALRLRPEIQAELERLIAAVKNWKSSHYIQTDL